MKDIDRLKDRVRSQYDCLAERYEERWGPYVHASIKETLRRLSLRSGERLLDIGCGPATLLRELLGGSPDARVAGLDFSMAMIRVARQNVPARVPLVVGDAESLPFSTGTFDVIVSSSSFHYWAAPHTALLEIARVLKAGGRVVVTDWCDDYFACHLCDLFLRWIDPAHRMIYGQEQCHRFLTEAGYSNVRIDRYRISLLWGLMTAVAEHQPV